MRMRLSPTCRAFRTARTIAAVLALACAAWGAMAVAAESEAQPSAADLESGKSMKLFDGKTLQGWRILDKIDFKEHGPVTVQDGVLVLEKGEAMTGVSWAGEFPTMGYEVTLEAQRIDGGDFFCGMTFPVGESHCSLVLGGWGGSLTGLSCVDGFDASENETTGMIQFKDKQWYRVRLRVTKEKIEAWVDNEQIVDLKHAERKLSLRWEMDTMPPFGIATWYTTAGLRNIALKKL